MPEAPKQPPSPAALQRIREQVRADPETARIAKGVGMTLEAYVDLVVDFAAHPGKEPEVKVVADESTAPPEAQKASMAEVKRFMEDVIAGKQTLDPLQGSGFDSDGGRRKYESVSQMQALTDAQTRTTGASGSHPALADDIARRRKGDVSS